VRRKLPAATVTSVVSGVRVVSVRRGVVSRTKSAAHCHEGRSALGGYGSDMSAERGCGKSRHSEHEEPRVVSFVLTFGSWGESLPTPLGIRFMRDNQSSL